MDFCVLIRSCTKPVMLRLRWAVSSEASEASCEAFWAYLATIPRSILSHKGKLLYPLANAGSTSFRVLRLSHRPPLTPETLALNPSCNKAAACPPEGAAKC